MIHKLKKNSNQIVLFILDILLISAALIIAFLIRFDFNIPFPYTSLLSKTLGLMILIRLSTFYVFSLYQGVWKYASVKDFMRIFIATSLGTAIFASIVFFVPRFYYPRSVLIIDWLLSISLITCERFFIRIIRGILPGKIAEGKRTLIVGAGDAGEKLLREILDNKVLEYNPIGFIDDDLNKKSKLIHNVKVLGNCEKINQIVVSQQIEQILIAIPSASGKQMRNIIKQCESTNISFKTMPGLADLIGGKVNVSQIRNVDVEDLLRREPVKINMNEISEFITNKVVLITGSGGSIGSEIARQVSNFNPSKILLLDHEETSIYNIEKEIEKKGLHLKIVPLIASVKDRNRISRIMQTYNPNIVFHAAAYKHVPLMEKNVEEAFKTNIFGTKIVAEEASKHKVEKFVLISSDKAVNPTSVMGSTKRICELVIENLGKNSSTKFVSVRFGNVLGSRGSVIPTFKEQILRGGPVEVTHPEMVRYFMTIPEAVQLVLQAGAIGKQTEIFILDMGEPVKIVDLARDLITLSGLKPEEDIEIIFTGLRPGEKLYEETLTKEEGINATRYQQIYVAKQDIIDSKKFEYDLTELEKFAENGNIANLITKIKDMIPGYKPDIYNLKLQYEKKMENLIKINTQ